MFEQSRPIEGSIEYFKELKVQWKLKIIAVNNEARELNEFRIHEFGLGQLFDAFISSCYVHLRKPDPDIFRLACDIAQTPLSNILYIDDRLMFVHVAAILGILGHHFQGIDPARIYLKSTQLFRG